MITLNDIKSKKPIALVNSGYTLLPTVDYGIVECLHCYGKFDDNQFEEIRMTERHVKSPRIWNVQICPICHHNPYENNVGYIKL